MDPDQEGKRSTSTRARGTLIKWVALAFLAAVLLILLLWLFVQPATPTEKKDFVQAVGVLLAALAGLGGLYFTWRGQIQTQDGIRAQLKQASDSQERTQSLTEQGQITDRFTRAIDQLGATDKDGKPRLEIRLGGIYALERIARDSPGRDYNTVMEVLTAYLREKARGLSEDVEPDKDSIEQDKEPALLRSPTDVQAILDVLRRREEDDVDEKHRVPLDLREANLKGANLIGAELKDVILKGAILQGVKLQGAKLQGANLHDTSLQGAILEGAFLQGTNLKGANLQGANLQGANLQGANLERANLKDANLERAQLQGAKLQGANLQRTFEGTLQGANLQGANLIGAILENADLTDANLEGAFLQGANLQAAFLRGANLERATLQEADLRGAVELQAADHIDSVNLQGVKLQGTDLKGAKLQGAKLQGADLEGADLEGANLRDANLQGAFADYAPHFEGANLKDANLKDADLEGAILEDANLEGTILEGASLLGANLQVKDANLQGAREMTQAQIKWTIGSNVIELPEGLNHPTLWSESPQEQLMKVLQERLKRAE